MGNRKRMRSFEERKGLFVDSTSSYSEIVDRFDGLQVLHKPDNIVEELPVAYTTRREFESGEFIRKIHKFLRIYFPMESQLPVSERFLRNRKESYRLLHRINKKRKALSKQSLNLESCILN